MNRRLEQYIKEHSSDEDPVLEELFRQTHIRFVNPNMSTGHLQGKLLEMISRMINPKYILEIGTFTGYSTICLARGLKPGGKIFTIELNDELKEFSNSFFKKAGVDEKVEQIIGNALEKIPAIDKIFDLVFIDGDKREYSDYYRVVKEKVSQGGYILADNVLWGDKVLDNETKDPQSRGIIDFNNMIKLDESVEKIIVPFRDGLTLIQKKW